MTVEAYRAALNHRTPDEPVYVAQNQIGPAVWQLAQEMVDARDAARKNIKDTPLPLRGRELGGDGLAAPAFEQSVGPTALGVGPTDALPDALTSRPRGRQQALPPPDPLPLAIAGELPGLDSQQLDAALRGVDGGPTLDDFTRFGTLPGFGDPAVDPFSVELRRRLTALIRSA